MAVLGATRTEFAADSPARTGWVAELIAQNVATIDVPFQLYFTEFTSTDATADGEVAATYTIPVPDYVGLPAYYLNLTLEAKIGNVLQDWSIRLVNSTDSINGDWVTDNNIAYAEYSPKVNFSTSADTDRLTTINVMIKTSDAGTTAYAQSIDGLTAWFSVS